MYTYVCMYYQIKLLCQTLRSASLVVKFLKFKPLSLEQLHLFQPRGRWLMLVACHSSLWPEELPLFLFLLLLLMSHVLQSLEFPLCLYSVKDKNIIPSMCMSSHAAFKKLFFLFF